MMRSAISVESALASAESKSIRSWKKTSCRPITPRPTGRQRELEAPASGVG